MSGGGGDMTMGERKCFAVGPDGARKEVPCGAGGGGGGGGMTMGERKCFAVGPDGAKKEVPCGAGGMSGSGMINGTICFCGVCWVFVRIYKYTHIYPVS
jgi:hypothetical protein